MAKRQDQYFNRPTGPAWAFERFFVESPLLARASGGDKNSYFGLADDPFHRQWPVGRFIKVTPKKVAVVRRDRIARVYQDVALRRWDDQIIPGGEYAVEASWFAGALAKAYAGGVPIAGARVIRLLQQHVHAKVFGLAMSQIKLHNPFAARQLKVIWAAVRDGQPDDPALIADFGVTLAAEPATAQLGARVLAWAREPVGSFVEFLASTDLS